MKCDVIIPVLNAPEWVKPCVERVIDQTPNDYLNKIIIIDDASNTFTADLLNDLAREYNKIVLVKNDKNEGFVKSINRGLTLTKAPYVLLLNSDCLITKDTIPKLIAHTTEHESVGLVSPVSNHSPVVSLEMVPGYSFIDMNDLVERLFSRMSFPACTIVGNCLLVTRACLEQTGLFDLCWGKGYGEESDYQFRAMHKGFEARIAIDTYVYHKSKVSFADDAETESLRRNHYQLFMEKWGKEYRVRFEQYEKNNPVTFMNETIKEYLQNGRSHLRYDVVYYLTGMSQTVGGVHVVIDIINYLILRDVRAGLVVGSDVSTFCDTMLFNYLTHDSLRNFLAMPLQTAAIVATSWNTVYTCSLFASLNNIPLIYFVQGYEVAFKNGINYGKAESTYAIADDIIVTSEWLHDKLLSHFGVASHVIPNGFDDAVFHPDPSGKRLDRRRTITMVLRGSVEKGDWVLMDVIKDLLRDANREIDIYAICFDEVAFGESDRRLHPIKGPLSRHALSDLLRKSDIFVDASLHEGFGMFPLEAMACGAVVIVSDSGGVRQFVVDGHNGLIINEVNKAERYLDAVKKLIDDPIYYQTMQDNVSISLKAYTRDNTFRKYIQYFRNVESVPKKETYKKLGAFHVQNMDLDTPHEYVELFVDTGHGFHPEQSIKAKFNSAQGKMYFKLTELGKINNLRVDPLNDLLKIKIKGISVLNEMGICFSVQGLQSNALFIEDSVFLFGTEDPQIIFKIQEDWGKIEKLVIDFEYLKKGKEVYEEILNKYQMKLNAQDEAIKLSQQVLCSRSWRMTKPLRTFMEFFRRKVQ